MEECKHGISEQKFYGRKSASQVRIEAIINKSLTSTSLKSLPRFMTQLLGPSRTWKIFKKQNDAINFSVERRNSLMCFAFEQKGGQRLFLVAHPKVFWAVNSHRFFNDCSTYEVIREYGICKLYLDVEFEYEFNAKAIVGSRMLNNFLRVINSNLSSMYGVICTENDIMDLNSSTEKKFSHHVIYQIPNVAFEDNYEVGNFIKKISIELKSARERYVHGCKNELIDLKKKYNLTEENILEFFVFDSKGNIKLFIDEGVYTKNRHFRLLGSTKMNKNSPLIISENNKYTPRIKDSLNCSMFLDSLVTYFTSEINNVLNCSGFDKIAKKRIIEMTAKNDLKSQAQHSDYPQIDNFIQKLISPYGGIRKKSYFTSNSRIIYDIYGYRYCENIRRYHKSNNIMFIVDLENLIFYQKCHDSDCVNFKSKAYRLPEEICFQLEDDSEFLNHNIECDGNIDLVKFDDDIEIPVDVFNEILSCAEDFISDSDPICIQNN